MAWIESHQTIATHRKTLKFARLLSISRPTAIGHLHLLWWWAFDNVPDGSLEGISPEDIADVVMWEGDAKTLFEALVSAGWIDNQDSVARIHDWSEYVGKLIDRRKKEAEKQKAYRDRVHTGDVTVTLPSRNRATVPYSTVPNSTQPDQKKPPVVPPSEGGTTLEKTEGSEIEIDSKATETWEEALEILRGQVSGPNFRTWFETTKGVSFEDGTFFLGTPNSFVADYLQKNQRSVIERILEQITGEHVIVGFTIAASAKPP